MQDIKTTLDHQGTVATLNCIRTEIRKSGLRWKQARIALTSTDPEYLRKLDAIKRALSALAEEEAFFSIDELGPVAVKMRAGRSLQLPGKVRTIPQWQESRGAFILTAALDLARNQIVFFFSKHKNSDETILLIDRLREDYSTYRKLFLSWDAAPWHSSARLREHFRAVPNPCCESIAHGGRVFGRHALLAARRTSKSTSQADVQTSQSTQSGRSRL